MKVCLDLFGVCGSKECLVFKMLMKIEDVTGDVTEDADYLNGEPENERPCRFLISIFSTEWGKHTKACIKVTDLLQVEMGLISLT